MLFLKRAICSGVYVCPTAHYLLMLSVTIAVPWPFCCYFPPSPAEPNVGIGQARNVHATRSSGPSDLAAGVLPTPLLTETTHPLQ